MKKALKSLVTLGLLGGALLLLWDWFTNRGGMGAMRQAFGLVNAPRVPADIPPDQLNHWRVTWPDEFIPQNNGSNGGGGYW